MTNWKNNFDLFHKELISIFIYIYKHFQNREQTNRMTEVSRDI